MKIVKVTTHLVLLTLSGIGLANAQDEHVGTLEDNFQNAELITLGRVADYRELRGQVMGEEAVCGYVVDIEVLHAFRGLNEGYKVFVNGVQNKPLLGERYFLTAALNPIYNKRGTESYTYCQLNEPNENGELAEENGAVDLSNYRYSTRGIAGSIHLVDPYLERKIGGDWLIVESVRGNRESASYVEENENPLHPNSYTGTDFVTFLQEYWPLISTPKTN